jgi:hypothetical protein
MANLTETESSDLIRTVIYGPPKRGKTHLAGTLAAKFKVLWFDLESGIDTLRTSLPIAHQKNINLISVRDTVSQRVALETVLRFLRGTNRTPLKVCVKHGKIDCPICAAKTPYLFDEIDIKSLGLDTVIVIDSLTQLTASAISAIGARINGTSKAGDTVEDELDYLKKFGFDEWELLRKIFTEIGCLIQASPCHIVCITHEQEVVMEDGTKKLVPVMGSSSFAASACKYFGDVIYCDIKNKSYVAQSTANGSSQVTAGSRTGLNLDGLKDKQLDLLIAYASKYSTEKQEIQEPAQATKSIIPPIPQRAPGILAGLKK